MNDSVLCSPILRPMSKPKTYCTSQLEKMTDAQLEKTIKGDFAKCAFPGKDVVRGHWRFYLMDGTWYDMCTGKIVHE